MNNEQKPMVELFLWHHKRITIISLSSSILIPQANIPSYRILMSQTNKETLNFRAILQCGDRDYGEQFINYSFVY